MFYQLNNRSSSPVSSHERPDSQNSKQKNNNNSSENIKNSCNCEDTFSKFGTFSKNFDGYHDKGMLRIMEHFNFTDKPGDVNNSSKEIDVGICDKNVSKSKENIIDLCEDSLNDKNKEFNSLESPPVEETDKCFDVSSNTNDTSKESFHMTSSDKEDKFSRASKQDKDVEMYKYFFNFIDDQTDVDGFKEVGTSSLRNNISTSDDDLAMSSNVSNINKSNSLGDDINKEVGSPEIPPVERSDKCSDVSSKNNYKLRKNVEIPSGDVDILRVRSLRHVIDSNSSNDTNKPKGTVDNSNESSQNSKEGNIKSEESVDINERVSHLGE